MDYVIGCDYGTNSCRAVLMPLGSSEEIAVAVYDYPSGEQGVLHDRDNPLVARQSPQDYLLGLESIIVNVLAEAKHKIRDFESHQVKALGFATTGSTVIPVDDQNRPMCFSEKFSNNLNAAAWLWKDHSSFEEAEAITRLASEIRPEYLKRCGGSYSSEWFWAKIWHLKKCDPHLFDSTDSFVELCDFLASQLAGIKDPRHIKRSVCAAGHKALYANEWGGLPDANFLSAIDPDLLPLASRLYSEAFTADQIAGTVCDEWALRCGLAPGTLLAVGAFDAHLGAIGAGVSEGTLVKIMGTSTCDILIGDSSTRPVKGVCGTVEGSVIPEFVGIEAGQSAVGDLFLWLVNHFVPENYGKNLDEKFKTLNSMAKEIEPGQSGLLALDWNNGNRSVLTDTELSGLILGQTLHTKPHEIYKALIEATAFGAKTIVNRLQAEKVVVNEVICCGGLAHKNAMMMQIYADVLDCPIKIVGSEQACAVGAAISAAAVYASRSMVELQQNMIAKPSRIYHPIKENTMIYQKLFALYSQLHDGFGENFGESNFFNVMKELKAISRRESFAGVKTPDNLFLLKKEVLAANKKLHSEGLVDLTWGNVSGIDREQGLVVIKPSGVDYENLRLEDLVVVNLEGEVVEGNLNPSSDTATHVCLYQAFLQIGGITHTHSLHATTLCQLGRALPCLGTTHADHFCGTVPLVRALTESEVLADYEGNTGKVIADTLIRENINPLVIPAVLQHFHAPFTFGKTATEAFNNAIALESCSKMALMQPRLEELPAHILNKHYQRKHGPKATYGQRVVKVH